MNLWALTLFCGATTISLVESGCTNCNTCTVDFDTICWKWWNKAVKYSHDDFHRQICVDLIVAKCSYMITITKDSPIRSHDGKSAKYETWTTTVTATYKSQPPIKYKVEARHPLCEDNGVAECYYWWQIARNNKMENKIKETCINGIWKHCNDKIEKISEATTGQVTRFNKVYNVVTFTYKYRDGTASFNHYVLQKKKN